jgi:serine/threonine-protein kinase RsbW
MPKQYHLVVEASIHCLTVLADLIDQATRENPEINEQVNYDLLLCMDEACSNIIEHGYEGLEPEDIDFLLEIFSDRVVMTLKDTGHPFDPNSAALPDLSAPLDKRAVGGLGLFFIKKTMDSLHYQVLESGNIMTLIKLFPPR